MKISYIARYAPDFQTVLSKKNPAHYLKVISGQFLMDVMERLDAMESECKKCHKEIKSLNAEVKSLKNENTRLKEELAAVKAQNIILTAENAALRKENQLLNNDNERMKRILNNDSPNSGTPPSADQPGKAPNTYNSRKPAKRRQVPRQAIAAAMFQKLMWKRKYGKVPWNTV